MKNNIKKDLKEIIKKDTNLPLEQKALWERFIDSAREKDIHVILAAIKNDPQNLLFLTQNMEDKIRAIINKDYKALAHIMEQEQNIIEEESV